MEHWTETEIKQHELAIERLKRRGEIETKMRSAMIPFTNDELAVLASLIDEELNGAD